MHLLIPFAAGHTEACLFALSLLKLPNFQKLLPRLQAQPLDTGDEFSLSPPHERVLARSQGLMVDDGLIPWAALQAQFLSPAPAKSQAFSFVSLCHWHIGSGHAVMSPLPLPDFGADESHALMAAMQSFFAEDGITLFEDQPGRWLAMGEIFCDVPMAAPDRVIGRDVTDWLPKPPRATPLLRLQNEMQMLLHTHPVNQARQSRGLLAANSFWLHGTGALRYSDDRPLDTTPPIVVNTLRDAVLTDNWPAWVDAWQALDACEGASLLQKHSLGQSFQLTFCGERHSMTWVTQKRSWMQKINSHFGRKRLSSLLMQL